MDITTKYGFTTYMLGTTDHPGIKLQIISEHLEANSAIESNKAVSFCNVLHELRDEVLKSVKSDSEFVITEDDEREYAIATLARQNATQLIATGRLDTQNMYQLSLMDDDAKRDCIAQGAILAKELTDMITSIEASLQGNTSSSTRVPAKFIS